MRLVGFHKCFYCWLFPDGELYGLLLKSQWMHLYYNSLLKLPLKVQLLTLKVSL